MVESNLVGRSRRWIDTRLETHDGAPLLHPEVGDARLGHEGLGARRERGQSERLGT